MKSPRKTFSDLYAEWMQAGWTLFTGTPPALPKQPAAPEQHPKAAQAAADQEWEDEGGSVRAAPKKPGATQGPKIPL